MAPARVGNAISAARRGVLAAAAVLLLPGGALADQLLGISNTAMAITGDVEFSDYGLVFADGQELVFDELLGDTFIVDGEEVYGSVFSILEPANPVLLNGNTLCGDSPVTYLANWGLDDVTTVIAMFDTEEAPASDAEMCASYTYEYE